MQILTKDNICNSSLYKVSNDYYISVKKEKKRKKLSTQRMSKFIILTLVCIIIKTQITGN